MSGSMISQTFCSYADLVPQAVTDGSSETGQSPTIPDGLYAARRTRGKPRLRYMNGIPYDAVKTDDRFIWLPDPRTGNVHKHEHGKRATYAAGCHCDKCGPVGRRAVKSYKLRREEAAKNSDGVDRSRRVVAAHIRWLSQEKKMGQMALSHVVGVHVSTIRHILAGDKTNPEYPVRADLFDKIMSITGEEDQGRHDIDFVPAALSAKRLQSLVALGYSVNYLRGRTIGNKHSGGTNWERLAYRTDECKTVTVRLARQIRDLCREIGDTPAEAFDLASRKSVTRALNLAKKNGWGTPASWDDDLTKLSFDVIESDYIDDDVDWVVAERLASGERIPYTFDERVEAVRLMLQRDVSKNDIRRDLRLSTETWRRIERCL